MMDDIADTTSTAQLAIFIRGPGDEYSITKEMA